MCARPGPRRPNQSRSRDVPPVFSDTAALAVPPSSRGGRPIVSPARVYDHTTSSGVSPSPSAPRDSATAPTAGVGGEARSWSLPVPDGAYAKVPAWTSREAWFDALLDVLATPEGAATLRAASVSRDTVCRVARADAESADHGTGRHVTTAHETVGRRTGLEWETVRKARRVLVKLGLAVVLVEGNYLRVDQRRAARLAHGGRQISAASVRALTMPRGTVQRTEPSTEAVDQPVDTDHLPAPCAGGTSSHLESGYPSALTRAVAASRRPRTTRNHPATSVSSPRPIELQRLAARVARRMPWLDRSGHIGALCDALQRAGVDGSAWSCGGLLAAVDAQVAADGWKVVDPSYQRDPLAYFVKLVRRAVASGVEPDLRRVARERAERAARAAQRAAEDDAARRGRAPMPAALRAQLDAARTVATPTFRRPVEQPAASPALRAKIAAMVARYGVPEGARDSI